MILTYKKLSIVILCFVVMTSFIVTPFFIQTAEANERISERLIRVGLLMLQGGHNEVVSYVTLSSQNGMEITQPQQSTPIMTLAANEEMLFHLDNFYLLFEETTDLKRAQTVHSALVAGNYKPVIIEESVLGESKYQVILGAYASIADAQTMRNKIQTELSYVSTIRGAFRLQSGAYNDIQTAQSMISNLRVKGFEAYLVTSRQNGNFVYRVWIGNEESAAAREVLLTKLKLAFVGQEFINAQSTEGYLLQKQANIAGKSSKVGIIPVNTSKIITRPLLNGNVPTIKVNERFNRQYRGLIELTAHNQQLAVINELPMDQYLYGVVPREMATGWPMEALKTQAVIARTFAMGRNGYVIAHVVDDVKDQAYWGFSIEATDTNLAVDQTRGQVLRTATGALAQTFYSSNAGGMSAQGVEVWGNNIAYLNPVDSSFDSVVLDRISKWYRVMLSNGMTGYIHANYVNPTGEVNQAGFRRATINGMNVNVRANADIYHESLTRVNTGEKVVIFDEVYENNAYQWSKGPYTPIQMRDMINANQRSTNPMIQNPVTSLVVSQRGPSGRVMQVRANGNVVSVSSPDAHRSLFRDQNGSLRSTRFEIDARGSYSILGANGQKMSYPQSDTPAVLYAIDQSSINATVQPKLVNNNSNDFLILNKEKKIRVATKRQDYVFNGFGFGHGFGLSQWGAYGMAMAKNSQGQPLYTYQDILHHYYSRDVYLSPIE
ncbi:hypothetical protein BHU72_08595 [Desulfuribacillus stibiiarsenatis]|uniref:SPOR domain-containing protein n=1 Tax=Desulfuribacillus stibiiarsenatis TaxID=1390249 RepID=A0A1E5L396_9FIRM|nr:SpoIID/LytB domain-containing protein [Desulfuribacillus stibiiarsenatis]OEH84556.1 hypothetical protein BHU72_08595 [Desulfuribacillus stibiiarsenatis]